MTNDTSTNAEDDMMSAVLRHSDAVSSLQQAQRKFATAKKDAKNPHFKSSYATLASVQEACYPALHEHGFAVLHDIEYDETGDALFVTKLVHENGTEFAARVRLLVPKNDMQALGSAITYARRYGLGMVTGLVIDEDDDGNAASGRKAVGSSSRPNPRKMPTVAKSEDLKRIKDLIERTGSNLDTLLTYYGAQSLDRFPQSSVDHAIKALEAKLSTEEEAAF